MEILSNSKHVGNQYIAASRKIIDKYFDTHFHEFYELEYVLSGSGTSTINGQKISWQAGTLFFLTPVDSHQVNGIGADVFNVMFSGHLAGLKLLEPFLNGVISGGIVIQPELRPFFESLLHEVTLHTDDITYSASIMSCLLLKLIQLLPAASMHNLSNAVTNIIAYTLEHYQERITLETVASHVGLTPSYVSALFKKEMQISYKTYLDNLRLDHAKKMVTGTKQSISDICEASGFRDLPNFLKRFKHRYGITPSQMRQEG